MSPFSIRPIRRIEKRLESIELVVSNYEPQLPELRRFRHSKADTLWGFALFIALWVIVFRDVVLRCTSAG